MLEILKPSENAIKECAIRETDMKYYYKFKPICWGRVGNALILITVGIVCLPWMIGRILLKIPTYKLTSKQGSKFSQYTQKAENKINARSSV